MAGCYGKVPALGDFLSRNLPAAFVEAWDGWLRRVMGACSRTGGEDWSEAYLESPIWRYVLAPGTIGDAGRAGVLVPSVDRIGRCFPLTIAVEIPAGMAAIDMVDAWSDGFERAEIVAIGTIGRALDPEAFVERVAGLPAPSNTAEAPPVATWAQAGTPADGGRVAGARIAGARIAGAPGGTDQARRLLGTLSLPLLAAAGGWSLWWHLDWDQRPATTVLFSGLPPPEAGCAMLLGSWKEGGWSG